MRHRTPISNRARAMRKAMTEPEVMLWNRLRGRRGDRPLFRRQHPMGSFILDFYAPSARLGVEADGVTHWDDQAQARDAARDDWLRRQGLEILRVPASRVYADLAEVVDEIMRVAAVRAADIRKGRSGG